MGGNFGKDAKPEGVDEYSPRVARNVSLGFDDLPPSTPRAYASSASKTTATSVDSAPKQEEMAARTAVTSEEGTPDHDSGAEDEGTGGSGAARPRRSRFGRGKTFLELNAAQSGQLGVQGAGAWECWWWKYPARHQKVRADDPEPVDPFLQPTCGWWFPNWVIWGGDPEHFVPHPEHYDYLRKRFSWPRVPYPTELSFALATEHYLAQSAIVKKVEMRGISGAKYAWRHFNLQTLFDILGVVALLKWARHKSHFLFWLIISAVVMLIPTAMATWMVGAIPLGDPNDPCHFSEQLVFVLWYNPILQVAKAFVFCNLCFACVDPTMPWRPLRTYALILLATYGLQVALLAPIFATTGSFSMLGIVTNLLTFCTVTLGLWLSRSWIVDYDTGEEVSVLDVKKLYFKAFAPGTGKGEKGGASDTKGLRKRLRHWKARREARNGDDDDEGVADLNGDDDDEGVADLLRGPDGEVGSEGGRVPKSATESGGSGSAGGALAVSSATSGDDDDGDLIDMLQQAGEGEDPFEEGAGAEDYSKQYGSSSQGAVRQSSDGGHGSVKDKVGVPRAGRRARAVARVLGGGKDARVPEAAYTDAATRTDAKEALADDNPAPFRTGRSALRSPEFARQKTQFKGAYNTRDTKCARMRMFFLVLFIQHVFIIFLYAYSYGFTQVSDGVRTALSFILFIPETIYRKVVQHLTSKPNEQIFHSDMTFLLSGFFVYTALALYAAFNSSNESEGKDSVGDLMGVYVGLFFSTVAPLILQVIHITQIWFRFRCWIKTWGINLFKGGRCRECYCNPRGNEIDALALPLDLEVDIDGRGISNAHPDYLRAKQRFAVAKFIGVQAAYACYMAISPILRWGPNQYYFPYTSRDPCLPQQVFSVKSYSHSQYWASFGFAGVALVSSLIILWLYLKVTKYYWPVLYPYSKALMEVLATRSTRIGFYVLVFSWLLFDMLIMVNVNYRVWFASDGGSTLGTSKTCPLPDEPLPPGC